MRTYWADHPEALAIFDVAMRSTAVQVLDAVVRAYDFAPLHTVVDIGGGYGALLSAIVTRTPGLRGVLWDRPEVVEGAHCRSPRLVCSTAVRCLGEDMCAAIPRGGEASVCARVIQDWDDACATVALRHCRRVIEPSGTLLVVEEVIPPGDAPSYDKRSDLNMLVGPGGQERTEAVYRALYTAAGFMLTRVMPTPARMSLIVSVPRAAYKA